ncbi:hypothetical protein PM082_023926 [Marasmius tenuissimus]|nr:hypothetical protein PM082_023926 [Marasmius tenuissimus]
MYLCEKKWKQRDVDQGTRKVKNRFNQWFIIVYSRTWQLADSGRGHRCVRDTQLMECCWNQMGEYPSVLHRVGLCTHWNRIYDVSMLGRVGGTHTPLDFIGTTGPLEQDGPTRPLD